MYLSSYSRCRRSERKLNRRKSLKYHGMYRLLGIPYINSQDLQNKFDNRNGFRGQGTLFYQRQSKSLNRVLLTWHGY